MKNGSTALLKVLAGGSISRKIVADIFYGPTRVLQDLPIESWTINGDITAKIKSGGSVTVAYTDDYATTVVPHQLTDALAAYGQEAYLYWVQQLSTSNERVLLGKFRIEAVPDATEAQLRFNGGVITTGSSVDLTLLDRFLSVDRATFRSLEQPATLSAWAEIARITKLAVTRNVPDATIPATFVYPRNRLDAVQALAKLLGGKAWMTVEGNVSILTDVPGDVVARLRLGDEGTIADVKYSMHSEGVCNVVYGDFETVDGVPIHVEAEITTGPLSVNGYYGEYVVEYDGDKSLITTEAAAQAAVDRQLALQSIPESYELPVQCVPNPLLEIGDVVEVERMMRLITGRILKLTLGDSGPMSLTLAVLNDVPL